MILLVQLLQLYYREADLPVVSPQDCRSTLSAGNMYCIFRIIVLLTTEVTRCTLFLEFRQLGDGVACVSVRPWP